MYGLEKPKARRANGIGKIESWTRKTLVFVVPDDTVSESSVYAVEREFPWIMVEQVNSLSAACEKFEHPVSLFLIDTAFLCEVASCSAPIARLHPHAAIALMQNDGRQSPCAEEVFMSGIVRGVLPMNLKLDIWLSVIRLMLRGGEYFPSTMFQPHLANAVSPPHAREPADGQHAALFGDASHLTDREAQILKLASRGLQNKNIAAALSLSEHTVKIHMHHIISKLGVHNRTEAAAIFHRTGSAGQPGGSKGSRSAISPLA
jgi:DNA-binding NarL/FixJ family response regulator